MSRRSTPKKRLITPDPVYQSRLVSMLCNRLLKSGKKSVAQNILYQAMEKVGESTQKDPLEVLRQAVLQVTPLVEVKSRRVGGSTYQVPVEVRSQRSQALAIRWLIRYSIARSGKSMEEKLAGELFDAFNNRGASIKKKEDTHKMAEANKAFAHYRW